MGIYFEAILPSLISIVKALLLLLVAFIVASIVKRLVAALMKRLISGRIMEKNPDFFKELSMVVAKISYIVILLLFIPAVFSLVGMDGAAKPIITMLDAIIVAIPNIIAAILIIYIGVSLANLCGIMVERLVKSTKLDDSLSKVIQNKKLIPMAKICSVIVESILIVFFVVQGLNVLHLSVLDGIGSTVIVYIPRLLAASLIFIGCFLLESFAGTVFAKGEHYGVAMLVKVLIYVIGVFMILSQLGIATIIVNAAFIIILAAVAVAFSIAFGIGGREFAAKILRKLEEPWKLNK